MSATKMKMVMGQQFNQQFQQRERYIWDLIPEHWSLLNLFWIDNAASLRQGTSQKLGMSHHQCSCLKPWLSTVRRDQACIPDSQNCLQLYCQCPNHAQGMLEIGEKCQESIQTAKAASDDCSHIARPMIQLWNRAWEKCPRITNLKKHDWSHRRLDHRNEHSTRRRPWVDIYPYFCYLSHKSSWHLIARILAHCLWASLFPSLFFFKFWFSALQLWADLAKCDLSWMSKWIERGARDCKGARKSNICLRQKLCSALICDLQVFVCFWNLLGVKDRNDNEPTRNITFPQSVNSSCKNLRTKGNLQMALHILHIFLFSPLLATENESTLFVHLARRPRGRFQRHSFVNCQQQLKLAKSWHMRVLSTWWLTCRRICSFTLFSHGFPRVQYISPPITLEKHC